jgi:hypothetical protein
MSFKRIGDVAFGSFVAAVGGYGSLMELQNVKGSNV